MRTLLLLALLAFQSGSTDPRIGSWTLVSAQSSLDPPNKLTITPVDGGGMHVVMSGETHLDFTTNPGGKQAPAPGNLGFNQIELHRAGKKEADVREKKDGVLVATVREKLSNTGNELTSTTTMSGQPDQVTVWTRSSGAKMAKDPFSGEWTEDMSKTRLAQGLKLSITADGTGGVHFVGGYSYTGRFDGKPYDLQNSRNDTMSLSLVDPHTVETVSRRDDQVTQKDRWVVSADGKQMTESTAATLENGQHLTEKLTFEKQS
jgi:hypothetical protein